MPSPVPARRQDLVEDLHGHRVADPYRWLEEATSEETARWRAAQDALAREHLDSLPGRDRLAERLRDLLSTGSVGAPAWREGRAFWTRRLPGQEHAVLLTRTRAPDGSWSGPERVLLDPTALDPSGRSTLDSWAPSKEGHLLAYQVSVGGDEESLLHVLDVATGEVVEGPITRCRYSPVAWEPGGAAYFYVRRLAPDLVPEGEEQFHRRVWRHVVGTPAEDDTEIWGGGLDITNYYGCSVSRDGRWLLITASAGTAPRDDIWIQDLHAGTTVAVQEGLDQRTSAWIGLEGRLWLFTDAGAPRGRLAVADPQRPQDWTTVVPEDGEAVLEDVEILSDGRLLVLRSRHAVSELSVRASQAPDAAERPVELPGLGAVTGLSDLPEGGTEVWLGWTSATTPSQVYRWTPSGLRLWEDSPGQSDLPDVTARLLEVSSQDGTTVRMQVLAPATGADGPDRPRPTVLYGYGGFSISLTPAYTASALAWVEAGGVWVVGNLRGGAEEGEAWHRAGMREHKQNVFDDFAACADHLVAGGWTTPEQLGIYGGSNGGLLVGAALTQRPTAQAAVVCSAPLLDMVRYERFGLGRTWNDEFGTASDPEELGWLLGYSPYHHVRHDEHYPAVLFTVFDGDSRVDPLHARKLCAALQHATASGRPVLLRDEKDVGHGARSLSRTIDLSVDVLTFLATHTGLEVP